MGGSFVPEFAITSTLNSSLNRNHLLDKIIELSILKLGSLESAFFLGQINDTEYYISVSKTNFNAHNGYIITYMSQDYALRGTDALTKRILILSSLIIPFGAAIIFLLLTVKRHYV